jgi:hypothetical protein
MDNWQSWTAGGIVVITLVIFLFRALRHKPGKGHCDDCSCKK